jgi:REP element-mobilizing transposase RayT
VYHVISRGNYRADVFAHEATKAAFLNCLGDACEKAQWVVHAWCVMSNHYHLLPGNSAAEGNDRAPQVSPLTFRHRNCGIRLKKVKGEE